jgi:hypothetical protein
VAQQKFGGGVKKLGPPPDPPPPPIGPIHISIDRSRREDSEYLILDRFDTCRPNVLLTGAS